MILILKELVVVICYLIEPNCQSASLSSLEKLFLTLVGFESPSFLYWQST